MRPRLLESPLSGAVDPGAVLAALTARYDTVFWLDSGQGTDGVGYLGTAVRTLIAEKPDPSLFTALRAGLDGPAPTGRSGFSLGWIGWIGYEMRAATMAEPTRHRSAQPSAAFCWVDRCIALDNRTGQASLLAFGEDWIDELGQWRDEMTELIRSARRPSRTASAPAPPARWSITDQDYLRLVGECQAAIRAGDAYQLCLTNEAVVPGDFDAVGTYLRLREVSPAHHGGFLRIGGVCLLSASPEQFLSVSPDGIVESRPIKGTRPRGGNADEDRLLAAELLQSEKERAENLMIVDLMRNDLGRVCEIGSVEVSELFTVESYAQVHQLVSTIRGRLRADMDSVSAVTAAFPAGSMTGAPKLAATRILDRLENRARGIYSGVFGYLGRDGSADLGMVIRSIVIDESGARVGAGGGVTALSVAEEELAEVKLKAAALLGSLVPGCSPPSDQAG